MNRHKKILFQICVTFFTFLLVFFSGCRNSVEYKNVKQDLCNVESSADYSSIDSILSNIPKYSEVCKNIRKNQLHFNSEILLNTQTIELYQNSKERAFALGMFVADLGYARYFERVQVCTDMLDATRSLATKLAIGDKEFSEYLPTFEQNINNEDYIFATIDSLLNNNSFIIADNEKYGLSALLISGFWIESTHLALAQVDISNLSPENFQIIENHFNILKQINCLLAKLSDTDLIRELKQNMSEIENKTVQSQTLKNDIEKLKAKYTKNI